MPGFGVPSFDLTFDYADADGRVERWGHGYTWKFLSQRQDSPTDPNSFAPTWFLDNAEIIPGLNAVSLLGYAPARDLALSGWTVDAGTWREQPMGSHPAATWLSYPSSRPDEFGYVTSDALYPPRLALHTIEFVPPADQTEALVYTSIDLLGAFDEEPPDYTSTYRIALPLHSEGQAGKYPQLGRGQPGNFEVVDEFQRADTMGGAAGGVLHRTLWIEFRDGVLIIRCNTNGVGWSEPWMYEPAADHYPISGRIGVQFYGHAGLFTVSPIYYPATGEAYPLEYRTVPVRYVYGLSALTQYGASAEGTYPTDWGLTSEWPDGPTGNRYRPVLGLSRIDESSSPLVLAIHDQFDPEFSAARTAPYSTQARGVTLSAGGDDPAEAIGLSWKRGLWRDWTFTATMRDPNDFWVDYLKPNQKVTVKAGLDDVLTQLMIAYVRKPGVERDGNRERGNVPELTVEGQDYILARIAGKKFMRQQASPVGWDLGAWAESVLLNANVVAPLSFPSGTIVTQSRKKALQFDFGPNDEVLFALDKVFKAHGWTPLAIDADGTIWSAPEPVYGGTPDFVLDETTAVDGELIETIRVDYQDEEFRNAAGVIGDLGALSETVDLGSIQDPDDPNFVGDDWWGIEDLEEGDDPATRAAYLLAEWLGRRQLLKWTRNVKTDLAPGAYVQVKVDKLDVPTDTVMRIVGDEGNIDPNTNSGRGTFYCEVVS